ncbi:MAG TPA: hydrogenase formation protein HypD [bacterium]|nr:hydrogenase formation protein HypD [bacterium]HQG45552.1 hydrogenase formation protein HypD [bacterium]HQI49431.1 hydrogenase formation protein HypD [bacterium]HQJ65296.1 hydrogenase formation protein HypD [bacterium]
MNLAPFAHPEVASRLLEEIRNALHHPWVIMETCGGQTHAILRLGLDQLLPRGIELVHGPGCPVCVTPSARIDAAIALAARPGVTLATFGDMMRVPGSTTTLFAARAAGGKVEMVYSALDALALARRSPGREIVFFAIGFETTAPGSALAVARARSERIRNFSLLTAHVLVPPAVRALLQSPGNRVQGYLAAGHACAILGWQPYEALAAEFQVPIVVTGFEAADLLRGIGRVVQMLEAGEARVENAYERVVRREGNLPAQAQLQSVFEVCDCEWRGIGVIPASGLRLRPEYAAWDAQVKFSGLIAEKAVPTECISGAILQGLKKPPDCPAFGGRCTPLRPLGAPMVSAEGACAAYFSYHRNPERA